jgi:hypothetical protein
MAGYMDRQFVVPRRAARKRTGSAELVYLLVVVAAAVGSAYWLSHAVGLDLSGIKTAAAVLGIMRSDRHSPTGYVPRADSSAPTAPYCAPGETPAFAANMASLIREVGSDMIGTPLECPHPGASTGDLIQVTTTGLVAYDKLRDTLSFTDGWRHWAVTPRGFVAWEGTDATPPAG